MKEPRKMDFVFVLYVSFYATPWRLYAPDILMFSTGSLENLTVGLLHGNSSNILIK